MLGLLGQVINPIRLGESAELSFVLCGYLFFDKAAGGGSSFFVCRRSVVSSLGRRRFVFEQHESVCSFGASCHFYLNLLVRFTGIFRVL